MTTDERLTESIAVIATAHAELASLRTELRELRRQLAEATGAEPVDPRRAVGAEFGLPIELITGDTGEEMRARASAIVEWAARPSR